MNRRGRTDVYIINQRLGHGRVFVCAPWFFLGLNSFYWREIMNTRSIYSNAWHSNAEKNIVPVARNVLLFSIKDCLRAISWFGCAEWLIDGYVELCCLCLVQLTNLHKNSDVICMRDKAAFTLIFLLCSIGIKKVTVLNYFLKVVI